MNHLFLRAAFALAVLGLAGCSLFPKTIKVGSKNTTTQMVVGEITAQYLESKGTQVVRRIGMGNTAIVHQATLGGDIDVYPEDTGTAIAVMLKENPIQDVDAQYERVRNEYDRLYGLKVIKPLGATNGIIAVVTEALAAKEGFSTITAAAENRNVKWRLGHTEDFSSRPDGLQAFSSQYRFLQKEPAKTLDTPGLYQAMQDGQLDLIMGTQSDAMLGAKGFVTLADDKHVFAPGQICLLVKRDVASAVPGLEDNLSQLSGKISTATLRALNREVDVDKRPIADVARDFLKKAGLK